MIFQNIAVPVIQGGPDCLKKHLGAGGAVADGLHRPQLHVQIGGIAGEKIGIRLLADAGPENAVGAVGMDDGTDIFLAVHHKMQRIFLAGLWAGQQVPLQIQHGKIPFRQPAEAGSAAGDIDSVPVPKAHVCGRTAGFVSAEDAFAHPDGILEFVVKFLHRITPPEAIPLPW